MQFGLVHSSGRDGSMMRLGSCLHSYCRGGVCGANNLGGVCGANNGLISSQCRVATPQAVVPTPPSWDTQAQATGFNTTSKCCKPHKQTRKPYTSHLCL